MKNPKKPSGNSLEKFIDWLFPIETENNDPHVLELSHEDEKIRDPLLKFSDSGRKLGKG